nr:hypothetical protein [Enterovibrio nigricans]
MYAFNQFAADATFTHRDETVSVLAALIGQHMKAFLPEQAALADSPNRAHFDDRAQNLEALPVCFGRQCHWPLRNLRC